MAATVVSPHLNQEAAERSIMHILKFLTNDDAQCICEVKPFASYHAAMNMMKQGFESICQSYATKETRMDEDAGKAQVVAGGNQYTWEIVDLPMYTKRYIAKAVDNGFCIWDLLETRVCEDNCCTPLMFATETDAENYMEFHVAGRDFN